MPFGTFFVVVAAAAAPLGIIIIIRTSLQLPALKSCKLFRFSAVVTCVLNSGMHLSAGLETGDDIMFQRATDPVTQQQEKAPKQERKKYFTSFPFIIFLFLLPFNYRSCTHACSNTH
jgi:hypothetical protein